MRSVRRLSQRTTAQTEGGATLAFSRDGRCFAFGTWRERSCWNVGDWDLRFRRSRTEKRGSLAFSPDGTLLADARPTGMIELIDPKNGHSIASLEPPHVTKIGELRFTPDGGQLAMLSADGSVHAWDLRRIRAQLAEMGLDWDAPALPPATPHEPLEVTVDLGSFDRVGQP